MQQRRARGQRDGIRTSQPRDTQEEEICGGQEEDSGGGRNTGGKFVAENLSGQGIVPR